jgi:hypothetical protein
MLPITIRPPAKDLSGEQSFAPERDEALCIKVPGVQSPEAHCTVRYRITSSARASIDCGIVRPIAFAVLRLMVR